jgi:hypothetical protein
MEKMLKQVGKLKFLFFGGVFLGVFMSLTNCQATPKMVVYKPRTIDTVLDNPYMGWAPSATGHPRKNGYYSLPHRLVYMNLYWSDLEPEKGKYEFKELEKINQFDYWTRERNKFILRLVLDTPRKDNPRLDIPGWLYEAINGDGTWYENPYGKGFSPNYANPVLIDYHRKLIRTLAERYNNDPRIAFIELGSLGHWGEWHTKTNDPRTPFPGAEIADQYVEPYLEYFSNKYLMVRRPTVIAKKHHFGLYNDMFGEGADTVDGLVRWFNQGYKLWLTGEIMPAMPDFWKDAPSGGEFAPSKSFKFLSDAEIDQTVEQAKLTHLSWLGPNCPVDSVKLDDDVRLNVDRFLNRIGYRLALQGEVHQKKVQAGGNFPVTLKWINRGVAPFYFDWKIELSLIDETGNLITKMPTQVGIRKIMPGVLNQNLSVRIPKDVAPENYRLGLAIIDPETNEPGIELAIEGKREDGRYTLGKVTVIAKK